MFHSPSLSLSFSIYLLLSLSISHTQNSSFFIAPLFAVTLMRILRCKILSGPTTNEKLKCFDFGIFCRLSFFGWNLDDEKKTLYFSFDNLFSDRIIINFKLKFFSFRSVAKPFFLYHTIFVFCLKKKTRKLYLKCNHLSESITH